MALSVYVVRAFVELRDMLARNKELATKVHSLERKVSAHERHIAELADSMRDLRPAAVVTLVAIGLVGL